MKDGLSNFLTALRGEHIKIRGTRMYLASSIVGLLLPLITFIYLLIESESKEGTSLPYNFFLDFMEGSLLAFGFLFFPLLIIMNISRSAQMDHKNGGWKLMEIHPLSKLSIYLGKLGVILTANLLAILLFVGSSCLFAFILILGKEAPEAASTAFPAVEILQLTSRLFVASLYLTLLQYALSVLIPSFIWSIVIGFTGQLATFIFMPFYPMDWNPFQVLANASKIDGGSGFGIVSQMFDLSSGSDFGYWFIYTDFVGLIGAAMLFYIGFQWYRHKSVKSAFFGKPTRLIGLAVIVLIGGTLLGYTLWPNQMTPHTNTVIAGKIESDITLQQAHILDLVLLDTIVSIPIINGAFHHKFEQDLALNKYATLLDNKVGQVVFFGNNDSTFIQYRFFKDQKEIMIYGTRIAENQLLLKESKFNFSVSRSFIPYHLEDKDHLEDVALFSEALLKEWENKSTDKKSFKTTDNYVPRTDYFDREKTIVATTYLNYWEKYTKKRQLLYPGEETVESDAIENLRKLVPLYDENLLGDPEYFTFISNQLLQDDTAGGNSNIELLDAIVQLKPGNFKDLMLCKQISISLKAAISPAERHEIMEQYQNELGDSYYRHRVAIAYNTIESLSRGKESFDFSSVDLEGAEVNLSDLKGKYVVIDVWASWCGPCKTESPIFEKYAQKYKNENVHFIALSIDEKKTNWLMAAKEKSQNVQHLLVQDRSGFSTAYHLEGIPRFIFIDPEGNFVSAQLPRPSDEAFEVLLRKALNLSDEA